MGTLMERQKQTEIKKRVIFLGTTGLGLVLALTTSIWLGVPLVGLGLYWGSDWFQFRARTGMRF
jgi:hypothetical protein